MPTYLETSYFREEYGVKDYPQKLCNRIYNLFFRDYVRRKKIENPDFKPKLLDIGSGKGNQLVGFSRLGIECSGLDNRDECLEILDSFDVKECDLEKEKMPFKDNEFDFIFTKSVIEHVWNTDNFLKETKGVLKPGGVAIIMTPDWKSEYRFFYNDYTHVRPFTRKGLRNALRNHEFSDISVDYFYQLPFIWKYPSLKFIPAMIGLLPEWLQWRDDNEKEHRELIRFSISKMLLGKVTKEIGKKSIFEK